MSARVAKTLATPPALRGSYRLNPKNASRIEDYALNGDCHSAALVARDGSIDWLCLPRFDSGACFAALLGSPKHGRWMLAPSGQSHVTATRRAYRPGTLVQETEYETATGAVRLIDFMPPRSEAVDLVRIVEGLGGQVTMRMELAIRFDYGSVVPLGPPHRRGHPRHRRSGDHPFHDRCRAPRRELPNVRRLFGSSRRASAIHADLVPISPTRACAPGCAR